MVNTGDADAKFGIDVENYSYPFSVPKGGEPFTIRANKIYIYQNHSILRVNIHSFSGCEKIEDNSYAYQATSDNPTINLEAISQV